MSATLDLSSIGYLCGCIQHSPNAILRAAKALGIQPAMKLNGISHFDAEQVERLTQYFREKETKR